MRKIYNSAKERYAAYRARHPERIRQIQSASRARHPETGPAYYQRRKAEIKAQRAAHRMAHLAAYRERTAAYYRSNRERIRQKHAEHNRIDREGRRRRRARRRALEAGTTALNEDRIAQWESKWMKKKSVVCYWCKAKISPKVCHTDHVVALSRGGLHSVDNVCIACSVCNLRKHAKSLEVWNQTLTQPALIL